MSKDIKIPLDRKYRDQNFHVLKMAYFRAFPKSRLGSARIKARVQCQKEGKKFRKKRLREELPKLNFFHFFTLPWASLVMNFYLHECMHKVEIKFSSTFWSWLLHDHIFTSLIHLLKPSNLTIKAFKKLQIGGNNSFTNLVGGNCLI